MTKLTLNETQRAALLSKAMTPEEAADYLCISLRTLEGWRLRGGGPKFMRYSARCIRYRFEDLQAWKESRLRRNTADNGGSNG